RWDIVQLGNFIMFTPPAMTIESPFFATAPHGLEELLAAELRELGLSEVAVGRGGVSFRGGLDGAYRACLWSRLANRVLLPLTEFEADDAEQLYVQAHEIDWSQHLGPEHTLAVSFSGVRAAIGHSRYAEQKVKDAVVDRLRAETGTRPSVDTRNPDVRINVFMARNRVQIAIDLSGESLHRRGYRETGNPAPLKENLAAAMLVRGDWPALAAGGGFVDPMAGSGTLAIEAAWMAGDVAPGLLRTRFGFLHWRGHDDAIWKDLIDEALERQEAGRDRIPAILALDRDPAQVRLAQANVRRAGLEGIVQVGQCELGQARPPEGVATGLVATNPPYGERLGAQHELLPLYLRLGETLKRHFAGWRALVLNGAGCELGLKPERVWQMRNGPLECSLERFEISASSGERHDEPARDLINRVAKNRKRLKKWLAREQVSCYRVYDADIPEYAMAVDLYGTTEGDWLHVQEYAAPGSVDERRAAARRRAALSALPDALDIAPERLVFKMRQRQRGDAQYRKQAEQSRFLEVREGASRLLVNLTDYLDTGLFLDHRPVRQWLHDNARGKSLLNLFCYTGAATVQAATGGACHTLSIDLSHTYLEWLQRNLELNGVSGPDHRTVRADAMDWLTRCSQQFDLIFLDPPSFSNSKKMSTTLDVQRDHEQLIYDAMRCLAPGGTLIFSTNLRSFRLASAVTENFVTEDRSRWSIPEDFERNRNIHRCWFIRHGVDADSA
ncbi:MAG: bifunctional 23S rRNA (guanine(2069)-N(7))-methyltransferase RlmK/23S rRNA (guanine(2445)-N(2))-methyltransferase RlmL, partial [Wenzhouxiangellaceae bacterium]